MRASAAASRQSLNQRRPEIRAAPEQEGREGLFGHIWSFVSNILPSRLPGPAKLFGNVPLRQRSLPAISRNRSP